MKFDKNEVFIYLIITFGFLTMIGAYLFADKVDFDTLAAWFTR